MGDISEKVFGSQSFATRHNHITPWFLLLSRSMYLLQQLLCKVGDELFRVPYRICSEARRTWGRLLVPSPPVVSHRPHRSVGLHVWYLLHWLSLSSLPRWDGTCNVLVIGLFVCAACMHVCIHVCVCGGAHCIGVLAVLYRRVNSGGLGMFCLVSILDLLLRLCGLEQATSLCLYFLAYKMI